MKKTILALALLVTLASCSSTTTSVTAPAADSSVVAVDTVAKTVSDSAHVESVKVK